jgi:hypothetical protein
MVIKRSMCGRPPALNLLLELLVPLFILAGAPRAIVRIVDDWMHVVVALLVEC